AVAYFAAGASKLLPLRKGSVLVVDMSERAVKSGQTDPKELIELLNKGVEVHSVENLHAKVFVLGDRAFVGSTNVSRRSADHLREAAIETVARSVVAACRQFVESLRGEPVDVEHAAAMAKLYRPPKVAGNGRRRRRGSNVDARTPAHAPLWAVALEPNGYDSEDESEANKVRPTAA